MVKCVGTSSCNQIFGVTTARNSLDNLAPDIGIREKLQTAWNTCATEYGTLTGLECRGRTEVAIQA